MQATVTTYLHDGTTYSYTTSSLPVLVAAANQRIPPNTKVTAIDDGTTWDPAVPLVKMASGVAAHRVPSHVHVDCAGICTGPAVVCERHYTTLTGWKIQGGPLILDETVGVSLIGCSVESGLQAIATNALTIQGGLLRGGALVQSQGTFSSSALHIAGVVIECTGGTGLHVQGVQAPRIESCHFESVTGGHMLYMQGVWGGHVSDCRFVGSPDAGYRSVRLYNCHSLHIDSGYISAAYGDPGAKVSWYGGIAPIVTEMRRSSAASHVSAAVVEEATT